MPTDTMMLTEEQVSKMIEKAIEAAKKDKVYLTKEDIRKKLLELPDQIERKFETTVVDYAMKWDDSIFFYTENVGGNETEKKGVLFDFIDLIKLEHPSAEDRCVAFAAFCVADNYARRNENRSQLTEVETNYSKYFENEPFLLHMKLCREIKDLEAFNKLEWDGQRLKQMLEEAKVNTKNLKGDTLIASEGNVGSAHILAEAILLAFENAPALLDEAGLNKERLLALALDTIEKVHRKDSGYAKFYCTHARLLAVAGRYEDALNYLNIAIDREDNRKSDYAVRVGKYISYSQQVRIQQQAEANRIAAETQLKAQKEIQEEQMQALTQALDEQSRIAQEKSEELNELTTKMQQQAELMEQQSKETTTKNMEFLGLFSGIVSFTIGSLTIGGAIAEQSIKHAAGLIIILMGALMGVFSAFGMILHGFANKKTLRNLVVLLMGIAIIIGGMWLCSQ